MAWVTLNQPPSFAEHARGEDVGEVAALGPVTAEGLLDVWEGRPILDVQHRGALGFPDDHVGATRELIVLIWLVDRDPDSRGPGSGLPRARPSQRGRNPGRGPLAAAVIERRSTDELHPHG